MKRADVLAVKARLKNSNNQPFCVLVPRVDTEGGITLALPYDRTARGSIVFFDGGHGEAALDWYYGTRAPRTPNEVSAAADMVDSYRGEYGDLIDEIVVRQRLPHDWRKYAWKAA